MAIRKGTRIGSPIVTLDDKDTYAVAYENDIAGARHIVANKSERNQIPAGRRVAGMVVYVTDDKKEYILKDNYPSGVDAEKTTNNDWEDYTRLTKHQTVEEITYKNGTDLLTKTLAELQQKDSDMSNSLTSFQLSLTDGLAKVDQMVNTHTTDVGNLQAKDTELQGNIDTLTQTVADNKTTAEEALTTTKEEINTTIEETKTTLQTNIDTLTQTVEENKEQAKADVEAEAKRTDSMINQVNENVSTIVNELNSNIGTIVGQINTNIESTKAELQAADTTLQENIDKEATRVDSMINQLNENVATTVDQLNSNITTITGQLNDAILGNKAEAEAAVQTLQGNIDTLTQTVADNKTASDEKDNELETRLAEVESKYNKPEFIIVGSKEATTLEEPAESTDVTLTDKLTEIDTAITTLDEKVEANKDSANEYVDAVVEKESTRVDNMINQVNENVSTMVDQLNANITTITGQLNGAILGNKAEAEKADEALQANIDTLSQTVEANKEEAQTNLESESTRVDNMINQVNENVASMVGQLNTNIGTIVEQLNNSILGNKAEAEAADTATNEKVDGINIRLTDVESKYNKPEYIVVGTKEDEDGTQVNVMLTERLGAIESDVAQYDGNFETINQTIEANKTSIESALEEAKTSLQGQVDTLTQTVTTNKTTTDEAIQQLNEDLTHDIEVVQQSLESSIDTLTETVANNKTSTDLAVGAAVTRLEGTISANKEACDKGVEDAKTELNASITAVSDRVTTIEGNYNKPERIVVGKDNSGSVSKDITLATKLTTIDSTIASLTQTVNDNKGVADGKYTELDGRLDTVEAVYNKPDSIMIGDVSLTQKLGTIDSTISANKTACDDNLAAAKTELQEAIDAVDDKVDQHKVDTTNEITIATADMATNASVNAKLADYAKTVDVDSKIKNATSSLQWRPSVVDLVALRVITTPLEGWTVSVDDTNSIYRFDAECVEEDDGDKYIKADDATAGAWVKLSTVFYTTATQSNDGLMSVADKTKLDGFTNASDYLTVANAATTYLGIHAKADTAALADNSTQLNGHEDTYFATAEALTGVSGRVTALEGNFTEGKAKVALALEGFDKADYATVEAMNTAVTDMATNASVDGKLANYTTTEALTGLLAAKADTTTVESTYATKDEIANMVEDADIANMNNPDHITVDDMTLTEKITEIDTALGTKADTATVTSTYATKTEIEHMNDPAYIMIDDSASTENEIMTLAAPVSLKEKLTTIDSTVAAKADTATIEANYATKEEVTNATDSANIMIGEATLSDKISTIETSVESKADKTAIADMATNAGVDGKLAAYTTTETLNGLLANKADTTAIATMNNPDNIMIEEESLTDKLTAMDSSISTKADSSALANYTTTEALTGLLDAKADKTAIATMNNPANIMIGDTSLTDKLSAVDSSISAKADSSALSGYATTAALAAKADATAIANMNDPAHIMVEEETSLTDKLSAMDSAISAKADSSALSGYATTGAIADMATNSSVDSKLSAYTNTEALTGLLDAKANTTALEAYTTTEDLTDLLAAKADTSAIADMATNASVDGKLANKADTSALSTYATKESVADMLTKTEAGSTYATKGELSAKADATALEGKADKTELANYATTEALDDKADASAIADMATNTSVDGKLANYVTTETATSTYATKGELTAKADAIAIADMATNASVDSKLANKADTSAIATMNNPANIMIGDTSLTDKLSAVDSSISAKADTSALSAYATTTALTEGLATKADSSALSGYATTDAISDMATNTNVAATYATKVELADKANTADVNKLKKAVYYFSASNMENTVTPSVTLPYAGTIDEVCVSVDLNDSQNTPGQIITVNVEKASPTTAFASVDSATTTIGADDTTLVKTTSISEAITANDRIRVKVGVPAGSQVLYVGVRITINQNY